MSEGSNMGDICKVCKKDGWIFPTHSFTNSKQEQKSFGTHCNDLAFMMHGLTNWWSVALPNKTVTAWTREFVSNQKLFNGGSFFIVFQMLLDKCWLIKIKTCVLVIKGQLISKAKFEVLIWTKKQTAIFLYFCLSL